ncbi:MAG: hypothetical protein KDC54_17460 [Lewinella sp.]|nr:hypothetical protein [Lewinella sp.]
MVLATELYAALQLPEQHYGTTVKKWINDLYDFPDGIRKPVRFQEYAPRKIEGVNLWQDYYLCVELAKQITLRSRSRNKQKYAKQLATAAAEEKHHGLSQAQFLHLLRVTKAMCLVSCQEECERRHLRRFRERNGDSAAGWWRYRAELLGYNHEELREKVRRRGLNQPHSQREMLAQVDPLELIRAGIIDLFMAIGKSPSYAQHMGHLAKLLSASMDLEIIDDQQQVDLFTRAFDPELAEKLKAPVEEQLVAA